MSSKKTKFTKPGKRKTVKAETLATKVARNGITQPGEGTACRAIWDALDALSAKGAEVTFEAAGIGGQQDRRCHYPHPAATLEDLLRLGFSATRLRANMAKRPIDRALCLFAVLNRI